jgi:DNA-binding PadR family transcriptional regulator
MERTIDDLLPLTPAVFHILLVLARGEAHGYAMMQEVERVTAGRIHLGPGTLYRSLDRMAVDGLVARLPAASDPADERRCLYRISPRGRAAARAEAIRLDALVRAARAAGLLAVRRPHARGATP